MCDTDVLLGGFGLFGGRGEYYGRIKVSWTVVFLHYNVKSFLNSSGQENFTSPIVLTSGFECKASGYFEVSNAFFLFSYFRISSTTTIELLN